VTLEIGVLLGILSVMVILFLTEKLPIDLTAFLGLATLTLLNYVPLDQAFSGFSSPAVITMLSVFIVSGGLEHTGVADMVGNRVHRWVGDREPALIVVIMMAAGLMSAFMNNIAAVVVLMPAVGSIARRSGVSPSRLFMPLSFGAILGGTTTLVGTPPNILVAELLADRGIEPFSLFDFTPVGLALLGLGTLYMATVGRFMLPRRQLDNGRPDRRELVDIYQIQDRLFSIRVPADSPMDGRTLAEVKLGRTLGVQVVAILRQGRKELAPSAETIIRGDDVFLVEGRMEDLQELVKARGLEFRKTGLFDLPHPRSGVTGVRVKIAPGSSLAGKTLSQVGFRTEYGLVVLTIQRGEQSLRGHLGDTALEEHDELIALGARADVDRLASRTDLEIQSVGLRAVKQLQEHVYLVRVPDHSPLVGETVGSSRLGRFADFTIGGLVRDERTQLTVSPDEVIRAGDGFLVTGQPEEIVDLLGMFEEGIDEERPEPLIESDAVGVVEATLTPRSRCLGSTIAELRFRKRYGLQILAVWREGRPIRAHLGGIRLRFGDALLLQGSWDRIKDLSADEDFVVLLHSGARPARGNRAPFAIGALLLMIGMVTTGFAPIHLAAFTAASITLLLRTLTMEEAYRAIGWRAIFLVAAVLPAGIAVESSGAALLLANGVTEMAGPLGPYAILSVLVVLSSLLSQGLDGAPAVVLVTPVALEAAQQLGLSVYPVMMGVGLAASAAFMTPFSHKANLMVMGAGGYRTMDYLKVGTPLTLVLLALLVVLVPLFFSF
jgi:di/tricarboxylate transporter